MSSWVEVVEPAFPGVGARGGLYRPIADDDGEVDGGVGQVENKLQQYGDILGLVVGAFGEGSKDLHSFIDTLAEAKVSSMGLLTGRAGTEAE